MNKIWLIYSADKNWGLGKNGDLLVHIPEDLKDRFRALTRGKSVLMGKKTLLSLPGKKGLPQRMNYVLTRSTDFECENAIIVHSLDDFFEKSESLEGDIFVIGGGEIYRQLLPYAEGAYVTKIYATYDADTFADDLDELGWKIKWQSGIIHSVCGVDFSYVDYINPSPLRYNK